MATYAQVSATIDRLDLPDVAVWTLVIGLIYLAT